MSYNNSTPQKLIVRPTRQGNEISDEERMAEIESKLRPFERMEMQGASDGQRILQGRNIVIPNG